MVHYTVFYSSWILTLLNKQVRTCEESAQKVNKNRNSPPPLYLKKKKIRTTVVASRGTLSKLRDAT